MSSASAAAPAGPGLVLPARIALVTRGVQAVATLQALLPEAELLHGRRAAARSGAVLAWGRKPSAGVARRVALRHGLPTLQVEDGFLRSVELGHRAPPLSVVVDDLGIYYDAQAPSRLEALVAAGCGDAERARAASLIARWRDGGLSKYNHLRDAPPPVAGPFVLVVDQTLGDASIRFGLADERRFHAMLEAALDEHPGLPVVLKVHPDVIAGRKQGHFGALTAGQSSRVVVCGDAVHPVPLLAAAQAVYTVTSQLGFEALLWGRPVRCFGMPFYAGWGLTGDALPAPARRSGGGTALESLAHAALVAYPRYLDPETGQRCEPERLVDWMSLQRRMRQRFPAQLHAVGFSRWKKPIVRDFLAGSELRFVRRPAELPAGAHAVVWGRRELSGTAGAAASVLRLEDGFLRSVGLGADLIRPLSWVADDLGLYYDATQPSGLERLLAQATFDAAITARAAALRERIVASGITKYNVGQGGWTRPAAARVILVAGQVESDASLAYGAPGLRSNIGLLQAVRAAAPDACIVYKPHPDVVARLRQPGEGEGRAARYCDAVVTDVTMHALLDAVDEVHVLTSLAGFEALLRGRAVTTYGCPFYAGWGLTTDRCAMPRRERRLALDELVAGTLILYPTYVSRSTGQFTTPERALTELADWRARGASRMPWPRRLLRLLLQAARRR